jgi:hypothetical protein
MQNEDTDFTPPEKYERNPRQAKGCCLLIVSIVVALFILVFAAVAGIIILDSVRLRERGREFTLERRVERYKVACQFLWFDFKEYVSQKMSKPSPAGPEYIPSPADPPESGPESETEPETEP